MSTASYGQLVWRDFRRGKLAMAGAFTIAFVLMVAVFCPFIANNRPVYIHAVFQGDYDNALGILYESATLLSQGAGPAELARANDLLDEIGDQLAEPEKIGHLRETMASLVAKGHADKEGWIALLGDIDALYDAKVAPTSRCPALRALKTNERFVLALFFSLLGLAALTKRLGWMGVLLTGLLVAGVATKAWNLAWPVIADSRPYRNVVEAPEFAESGGDVVWAPVPFGENENIIAEARQSPSWALEKEEQTTAQHWHWLGTDTNGRDVLARMVYGSRVSMVIGIVAVAVYTSIGILLGAVAGYFGGWTDIAISRIIEVVICFPPLLLILAVQAFLAPSVLNIIIALAALWWTTVARLQRAEFLRLVNLDYVRAIRGLGGSNLRIIFLHILPNGLGPILVLVSFGIAGSILIESGLSFLGFGVPQPMASWGDLLNNGRNDPQGLWWLTIFPGLAIFVTVTSFNLIGEGLRDALDPMRER